MSEKLYIKADLIDEANLDNLSDEAGKYAHCTSTRESILERAVNPDELTEISTGSYQGTKLFVLEKDNRIWLVKDSYGSCSHCDGLLASDHERAYADSLLKDAYCFESTERAIEFLQQKLDDADYISTFQWSGVAEDGIEVLESMQ